LQITRDHSEVQGLVDQGVLTPEEGRTWPRRNVITRAIGVSADPGLEIEKGVLADGDIFVICSDGLTTHVSDSEIHEQVATRRSQGACDDLVALSLQRGGNDNITVIVVRCCKKSPTLLGSGVTVSKTWE
jgi:protein phosphatase